MTSPTIEPLSAEPGQRAYEAFMGALVDYLPPNWMDQAEHTKAAWAAVEAALAQSRQRETTDEIYNAGYGHGITTARIAAQEVLDKEGCSVAVREAMDADLRHMQDAILTPSPPWPERAEDVAWLEEVKHWFDAKYETAHLTNNARIDRILANLRPAPPEVK